MADDFQNYFAEGLDLDLRHNTSQWAQQTLRRRIFEADGRKCEGEFKNDKKEGQGVFTWSDASKCEGQFNNDKTTSQGVFTHPHGDKLKGESLKDFPEDLTMKFDSVNWRNFLFAYII